jgi:hypothetical protein
VRVEWNPISNYLGYQLRYRPQGTANWTTVSVADTTRLLTGLNPALLYEMQIRSRCDVSNNSEWTPIRYVSPGEHAPIAISNTVYFVNEGVIAYNPSNNFYYPNGNNVELISITNLSDIGEASLVNGIITLNIVYNSNQTIVLAVKAGVEPLTSIAYITFNIAAKTADDDPIRCVTQNFFEDPLFRSSCVHSMHYPTCFGLHNGLPFYGIPTDQAHYAFLVNDAQSIGYRSPDSPMRPFHGAGVEPSAGVFISAFSSTPPPTSYSAPVWYQRVCLVPGTYKLRIRVFNAWPGNNTPRIRIYHKLSKLRLPSFGNGGVYFCRCKRDGVPVAVPKIVVIR